MDFLYGTVCGRILLKILLHAKVLKFMEKCAESPLSKWMIRPYIRRHKIDMRPFEGQKYTSFAGFFARKRPAYRWVKDPDVLISPCDGLLSIVPVRRHTRFLVKGSWYSLSNLIPEEAYAERFAGGLCMILRLQAKDYHHFCYIDDCYHGKGHRIEGTLHSVQPAALVHVPVFRLNRRMWSIMETLHFGTVAQVEVGAVLVGGIVHEAEDRQARRGDEMGHFELCGSTILLFFQKEIREQLALMEDVEAGIDIYGEYPVKMGQAVARRTMRA